MKTTTTLLLTGLLCLSPVAAWAGEASLSATPAAPQALPKDDKKLAAVVVDYVRNARGWMDNTYAVTYYGKDGDNLVYSIDITRGDSVSNVVTAEGQSFKVVIDPKTRKVAREFFY